MNNPNFYENSPREFTCMDDSPLNNGWGYQDKPEEREEPDEEIPDEEYWEHYPDSEIDL